MIIQLILGRDQRLPPGRERTAFYDLAHVQGMIAVAMALLKPAVEVRKLFQEQGAPFERKGYPIDSVIFYPVGPGKTLGIMRTSLV